MPKYLLTERKHKGIDTLDFEKPAHFHHLAEIWRRRRSIAAWLYVEKKKLNVNGLGDSELYSKADRSTEVNSLLKERDDRIIKEILDLARLKAKKKRELVAQACHEARKISSPSDLETHAFIREIKGSIPSLSLNPREKIRLQKAFSDWFNSMKLFQEEITLAGGGVRFR